jgi:hypothetical protein
MAILFRIIPSRKIRPSISCCAFVVDSEDS